MAIFFILGGFSYHYLLEINNFLMRLIVISIIIHYLLFITFLSNEYIEDIS